MGSETLVSGTETPYRKTPPSNFGSVAEAGFTKTPPAVNVSNYGPPVVPPTAHTDAAPVSTPINTGVSPMVFPTISGTTTTGQTLTCAPGTWSPAASSYTYQWFSNDVAINGATAATRVLAAADTGKRMSCRVTGIHATAGGGFPVVTAQTAVIA